MVQVLQTMSRPKVVQMSKKENPTCRFPDQAKRAVAEAAKRHEAKAAAYKTPPVENGGRGGPDPVRFGDWEKKYNQCNGNRF